MKVPMEWFYSRPVPYTKYLLICLVINHKSKHSDKPVKAFFAPFLVCLQNHFCIGMCKKLMAFADEIFLNFRIIVYLAIKNNNQVICTHRLGGSITQVNN